MKKIVLIAIVLFAATLTACSHSTSTTTTRKPAGFPEGHKYHGL